MHQLLLYDYVPNVLELREPFRPGHLAAIRAGMADGSIVMAGAVGDPVDGALIIFRTEERALIDAFVAADPYVQNGLVTGWQVKPWTVVLPA